MRLFVRSFVRIYFSHDYLLLLSVIRNIVEYIVDISVQLTETRSSDWETASCRRDACRPPDNKHAKRTFSETRGLKKKKKRRSVALCELSPRWSSRISSPMWRWRAVLSVTWQMLIFLIYTTLFLLHIASLLLFRLVYHRILSFSFLSRPSLAISVFIEHCNYLYSYFSPQQKLVAAISRLHRQ